MEWTTPKIEVVAEGKEEVKKYLTNLRNRKYYAANSEKVRTKKKAAYWVAPEKARSAKREQYHADPEKTRARSKADATNNRFRRRKRKYGITRERWGEMFEAQARSCAICGSDNPGHSKLDWATDHDHVTGKVRGILCHPCNIGLKNFRDDPEKLIQAAAYLREATNGQ